MTLPINIRFFSGRLPLLSLVGFILLLAAGCAQADTLVRTQKAYKKAVANARPGDTIVLANGVWHDFDLLFHGAGTAEKPITLTAQTKGKVILSGQSSLRLAGEHLVVNGLVFKDGYTPRSAVISFRRNKTHLANHSRVTETVIDNYNNPERYEVDFWVMMYGKHNRFDHNHLIGKKNKGVTMAVRLNTPESQENHHRIDHNYFGPRPILGSNGGETLRIGTSHYSLTNSNTVVEHNYFDRCDGELEIISIKSGGNVVRNNTFYESQGTLTLRHGNGNLLENNVFFGNGVDHTGGIRVINKNQTVINNYMEGLTGYRFGGALVVMNGVPNSPINRYHQVDGAHIANNTIVDSDHIQLAAGSDKERAAVPVNSHFERNLVFHENGQDVFTVYDDISGITFQDNISHVVHEPRLSEGFTFQNIQMERAANGLLYPVDDGLKGYGISKDFNVTGKDDVGIVWYPKMDLFVPFKAGMNRPVQPGDDALYKAVKSSLPGDILELAHGAYPVAKVIQIPHPLTIRAKSPTQKPYVTFSRSALFEIKDGGSLQLENLHISGADAPDNVGNSLIRTHPYSMLNNYRLQIHGSDIVDLTVNRAFNLLNVAKSTMADEISITNTRISNVSGAVLLLNRETDDFGIFNANYVTIVDSQFTNIGGEIVNLYRGGRDESTFGPHFYLQNSNIEKTGQGARNKSGATLMLHGVQVTQIENTTFTQSAGIKVEHTVSEPVTTIINNHFHDTASVAISELVSHKSNTATIENNQTMNGRP